MKNEIKIIRRWLIFFMVALVLSGVTAMPVERELAYLAGVFPAGSTVDRWIEKIYFGVAQTNLHFPYIGYGYDWLAFAHIVLAVLFIGPYQHPVRNKWVIQFGMIACLMVIPFALVAGHIRGIPFWWRIVDCSFGIAGLVPLNICLAKITSLERVQQGTARHANNILFSTLQK
jgi:hypothetical protein